MLHSSLREVKLDATSYLFSLLLSLNTFSCGSLPQLEKARVRAQAVIFKEKYTYVMTFLYIMCFGSFIGYSGSFPKLITDLFGYITDENGNEITNPNAPNVFNFAWMGAAVGSLIRPIGGVLSDKFRGAKVTMVAILVCMLVLWVRQLLFRRLVSLRNPRRTSEFSSSSSSCFSSVLVLWTEVPSAPLVFFFEPEISGPVLGWSSAIVSYGAFVIPAMFGVAIAAGKPETTFWALSGYYVACAVVNFWFYIRPGCEKPGV